MSRHRDHLNNNVDLPNEDVLKAISASALGLNGTKYNVSSVINVASRPHSAGGTQNVIAIDYSANINTTNANSDYYPISVLMKNFDTNAPELMAYSTLFKDMDKGPQQIISSRSSLYNLIPRPYLVQKPTIFLENMESSGFSSPRTKDCLNLDFTHCLLAVETMAKFHASSYFLRRQLGVKGKGKLEMLQKYPFLSQNCSPMFSPKHAQKLGPAYENGFELALKMIEHENPSLAFKLRRKVDPATIFDKVVKLVEEEKYENDDFYVVCQGNYQSLNLLFKYSNGEPKECRITNFQSIFFGPLASDLALFLLTCTTLDFRLEFEEKLLAFYCDAFEEELLARHDNNPVEDFDIEEFHRKLEKQYKKMLEFAFYNVCIFLPLLLYSASSNAPSCEDPISQDTLVKFFSGKHAEFENFTMQNSVLRERLVDILKQLIKYRVLL